MLNAIKQNVTVQRGGRIEVFVPELPEGTAAEMIVLDARRAPALHPRRGLVGAIGRGQGAFASAEDADRFLRAERDQWP